MLQQLGEDLHLMGELLVAALHGLLRLVDAALHHFDVRHDQLQIDDVDIPQRVGGAFHVVDVAVLKAADNMDDGVGGADIAEELVAQTLALGGTLDQTGDIHELDHGRGGFLGLMELGEPVQPLVRNGHNAHIGVNGAERVIVRRDACVCDRVEQSGLAHIGKSHNT